MPPLTADQRALPMLWNPVPAGPHRKGGGGTDMTPSWPQGQPSGRVRPVLERAYKLDEAGEALRHLIEDRPFGRVVLAG
jgi:hypothetical protein